MTTCKPWYSMN